MWSYVGNKNNKYWIWLAIKRGSAPLSSLKRGSAPLSSLDVSDSMIVGAFIGDRSETSARGLGKFDTATPAEWNSLPKEYQKYALCYTDFWEAYALIFPTKRHLAVGKKTGRTNQIEGFNCKMRQRVARLVRKTLSFSKKLANHIGAIWAFIHYHNQSLHV